MQCGRLSIHCEGGEEESTCPTEGEKTITLMFETMWQRLSDWFLRDSKEL